MAEIEEMQDGLTQDVVTNIETMRYICNHQEAPWTIYIQQMGAIISVTITDSNCAKNNFDYR